MKRNKGLTTGTCLRIIELIAEGKMYKQIAAEENINDGYVSVAKSKFPLLFWAARKAGREPQD